MTQLLNKIMKILIKEIQLIYKKNFKIINFNKICKKNHMIYKKFLNSKEKLNKEDLAWFPNKFQLIFQKFLNQKKNSKKKFKINDDSNKYLK